MDVPILKGASGISRFEPLVDFVLIQKIELDLEMSAGGMIIPDIAQTGSNKGRVIAIGEGRIVGDKILPIPLEPGDVVLFSKYAVEEIKLDDEDYILVRYDELKLRERRVAG